MQNKRIARKKLNPAVKKHLGEVVALLDRRVQAPLGPSTICAEANHLYKLYPFKYKGLNSLPLKARDGMTHFLIVKGAQKAGFSASELSQLARIINLHKQDYKSMLREMDKIGKETWEKCLKN